MTSLTKAHGSQRALTQNGDKFYALPYDCKAHIRSFLTVQGIARLTTVCKKDFAAGNVVVQTRELFLRLVLENPKSSGQALLRAIDQDKVEIVSALLEKGSDISATVGVVFMQKIKEKSRKQENSYYDMFVTIPPRYRVLCAAYLHDQEHATRFLKPFLSTTPAIPPDWLGEALMQVLKRDRNYYPGTKRAITDLLLNHGDIPSNYVEAAFLTTAKDAPNAGGDHLIYEETLLLCLKKELTSSQKKACLLCAAEGGYRRAVASLIKSLGYPIDSCRLAFTTAVHCGKRELVQDFLADRLNRNIDSGIIGEALVIAAKGWKDIVRDLLESTPTLSHAQVRAALEVANAEKAFYPIGRPSPMDPVIQLLESYLSLHAGNSRT